MLTQIDIEYMRDAQDEIYVLRERPITLITSQEIYDEITGELLGKTEQPHEVQAVITELSIRSKDGERYEIGGIVIEQGDIKVDVKREFVESIGGDIIKAEYGGKKYEILGGDRKGIGLRNRTEYIGRGIA